MDHEEELLELLCEDALVFELRDGRLDLGFREPGDPGEVGRRVAGVLTQQLEEFLGVVHTEYDGSAD